MGSATEINRRIGLASSTFACLGRLWESSDISLKLKCQLYSALVQTILLYNGECWLIDKHDMARLEGFNFRCARRITRQHRRPDLLEHQVDKVAKQHVFEISGLPRIEAILQQKRLRWYGHLMRQTRWDPAKESLEAQIGGKTRWGELLLNDFHSRGIAPKRALKLSSDRHKWRTLSSHKNHGPDPRLRG